MAHTHKRQEWWLEGCISLATGTLYGLSNTLTGHPLDTVKSKMQAQSGFLKTEGGGGMLRTMGAVVKADGVRGFYKGVIPPMWGSMLYRSAQFAMFEGTYTKLDNEKYRKEVPGTSGVQYRTVIAAIAGGTSRAVLESPIEYAKVRRQTGKTWRLSGIYNGFGLHWARTCPMITIYFIAIDSLRRHTSMFQSKAGQFLASGGCATFALWCVWPIDTLRVQVQANTHLRMSSFFLPRPFQLIPLQPSLPQQVALKTRQSWIASGIWAASGDCTGAFCLAR